TRAAAGPRGQTTPPTGTASGGVSRSPSRMARRRPPPSATPATSRTSASGVSGSRPNLPRWAARSRAG
ncbi:unnamed protein product, partial [Prorocentrum cordatum]